MSRHRAPRSVRDQLSRAWDVQPYSLTLALTLAPVGLLAILMGDGVSAALSNLAAGIVSRAMGACLLSGSTLVLVGIVRRAVLAEVMGLALMSAGAGIYGAGVILGLGWGGMVAGPGYLAVAVASLRRVTVILALADEVDRVAS